MTGPTPRREPGLDLVTRASATTVRSLVSMAALLMLALTASAQEAQGQTDTLGWHLVRPGDTLEEITKHYLGTPALWQENWSLNPHVRDPHLLRIGDRLRIIVHRRLPPQTAEMRQVHRRVEAKPHPNPWTQATKGDLLKAQDGVRTFKRSSAEIGFEDGTSLVLTESSLIFLRELDESLVGVAKETIEVVEGQADLESRPRKADSTDIEILLGEARARPRVGSAGVARSRLRRGPAGEAQVMVYGGATQVEAAGEQVSVPAGMGTNVPQGRPPEPPEKLLEAPRLSLPASGARIGFANPTLTWEEVGGAASYTVEICLDSECKSLVDRVTGLTAPLWQTAPLPKGELRWRVTATSRSGLDGRPSRSRAVVITSSTADLEPPTVILVPGGRVVHGADGSLQVRPGDGFRLEARDDAAGVASIELRWGSDPWQESLGKSLSFPSPAGTYQLEARATDRLGRVSAPWLATITVESEAPAAPTLRLVPPAGEPSTDVTGRP